LAQISPSNALVGVTSNSIGDTLAKNLKFSHIYRKTSSEQVFELILKGKLDYTIFSESVANKHCSMKEKSKPSNDCLFPINPPIKTNAFHTIYSHTAKNQNIAKRIELATKKLIDEEKVKQIFLSSGYSEQEYKNWLKARKIWVDGLR
jgi:hypothetical protein